MIYKLHEQIRVYSVYIPLFLTFLLFLLIGNIVMDYYNFGIAIFVGILLAGALTAGTINLHMNRLVQNYDPQIWEQASQLRFESERCAYLATHDILTGLYNRIWLDRFLANQVFQGNLFSSDLAVSEYSIVMIDINNLRMINEQFGFETGNRCLNHLTTLLKALADSDHMLVRTGGDEFIILMPNRLPEQVSHFLSRLEQTVTQDLEYPLHISWSTASTSEIPYAGTSLLSLAEERLVTNKLLDQNSTHSASLKAILGMMHERHQDTEEHMTRLQNLALALAQKTAFPEKQFSELRLLARLHDIGKIVLSDSILLKNGPLDDEEWVLVRQHPEVGARLVEMIPDLRLLSPAILAHHERWDGQGYPNRLAGEEIPLAARIISLVDAWDAMTNDRPYRKALSFDQAFHEIMINSGKQFDPVLGRYFLDILEQFRME